jgi:divalent metal cation (Fe/Co/Zn/Cd) transporter
VYYKDDGHLVLKVDISMKPELTIKQAHISALKLRLLIINSLQGVADVDVDLELDENSFEMTPDNSSYFAVGSLI